jgi:hypothetical protein
VALDVEGEGVNGLGCGLSVPFLYVNLIGMLQKNGWIGVEDRWIFSFII